jgi:LysM repeat protein
MLLVYGLLSNVKHVSTKGSKKISRVTISPQVKRGVMIGVSTVVLVVAIYMAFVQFTGDNAYEISVGDRVVGYVEMKRNVSPESIEIDVEQRIRSRNHFVEVQYLSDMNIRAVRVGSSNIATYDFVISTIADEMDYLIPAVILYVDSLQYGILRNVDDYNDVLNSIKRERFQFASNLDDIRFVEAVRMENVFVKPYELEAINTVIEKLNREVRGYTTYTVVENDFLSTIAARHNITLNTLLELNEGVHANTIIKPGDKLRVPEVKFVLNAIR